MSEVVARPPARHSCRIGWEEVALPEHDPARSTGATHFLRPVTTHDPVGAMRECTTCGTRWTAVNPPRVYRGTQKVGIEWVREPRWRTAWRRRWSKRAHRGRRLLAAHSDESDHLVSSGHDAHLDP